MIYDVCDLVRDVRIALDQNMTSDQLIRVKDLDTLSLEDIIRSKVEDGVRRVESMADVHLLDSGHNFGEHIFWGDRSCGWILLPDDFMRLIAFRMSDWERTVHDVVLEGDEIYVRQSSRFSGIRGCYQNPICALVMRPEGKVLEFYSCKSNEASVVRAIYLPDPHIDNCDGIEICERCYISVVYMIGSLTAAACGNADMANLMTELSKSALI